MKQWFVTYAILLGSFAGAIAVGRQLYHNRGQLLWASIVVAGVVFVILTIVLLTTIPTPLPWEEQDK